MQVGYYPGRRRLLYLIGRYRPQLEADFARRYPQHSLGDLWRARRWRYLLNLIDHLPQDTYFHATLSQDPEHAKMLAEVMADQSGDAAEWAPPMQTWSPEVDTMHKLLDALNRFQHTAIALKVGSQKAGNPPKPHPRPKTAFEKAKVQTKRERHEALANRILARRKKRREEVQRDS